MSKVSNMAYTAVLLTSKTDLMREHHNAFAAVMLSIYCRTRMNGGLIEDIDKVFADHVERGEIGLSAKQAKRVLATQSKLWKVEENSETGARDLRVLFYSVFHEKAALNMSTGGRAGGLKSAAKRKQDTGNNARPKFSKNGKLENFGSPCGAPSGNDKTAAIAAQNIDNKKEAEKDTAAEIAPPLARGRASKEKDIFLSEKYQKSGGFSEDTPPALCEEENARLSDEETRAFFAEMRAELDASSPAENNA